MPLSQPADRELLASRDISIRGYQRADGDYDIEAHLVDTKSYGYGNPDRGYIQAGEPLHGLWARMTVDDKMLIVSFEAASDFTPYAICPNAATKFASLAGLTIGPGFLKAAAARIGGAHGCTHLRELLQQLATMAFQTISPARARRQMLADGADARPGTDSYDARVSAALGGAPALLNTCLAFGTDSPVVRRRWPHLYTGQDRAGLHAAPDHAGLNHGGPDHGGHSGHHPAGSHPAGHVPAGHVPAGAGHVGAGHERSGQARASADALAAAPSGG